MRAPCCTLSEGLWGQPEHGTAEAGGWWKRWDCAAALVDVAEDVRACWLDHCLSGGCFCLHSGCFTALHCLEFLCYVNRLRNKGYEIKAVQHNWMNYLPLWVPRQILTVFTAVFVLAYSVRAMDDLSSTL